MKNNKLITLFLALLVCFSLVVTVSAASDNQNLTIAVEANPSTVVYGNTIKVSVMINENPGFLGVNFDVKWDTAALELVSSEKGTGFNKIEANYQKQFNKVVVTVGDPLLGVMYPSMAEKYEGTGNTVTLTFKVKDGADVDATPKVYIERASYVKTGGSSSTAITLNPLQVHVVSTNHKHTPGAAATCTTDQICTHCFAVLDPAKGHKWVDATCTTPKTCSVCKTTEGSALGHKTVVDKAVAPTCTTTGLTEGSHCSVCNEVFVAQQKIDALGHKTVVDKAVAPTCTTSGLTEGSHCSVCGEILVAQNAVAALGHKVVVDKAVAPTCTKTGLTEGKHCSVCGEVLLAQAVVAKLPHTSEYLAPLAPTCTTTGLTEGSKCSVCGEILVAQEVIPANGHNMTTDFSYNDASGHWNECKTCGFKDGFDKHNLVEGECTVCKYGCEHAGGTATCTEKAVCTICAMPYGDLLPHTAGAEATCTTAQICTVCSVELAPALGHTPGAAATCTTAQTCTVCTVELAPALGHTPGAEATCTTAQTCSVCSAELVPAKGHTPENIPSVAPTCTGTGLAVGSKCSVCSTILKEQEVVPATGHDYTSYWINGSESGHWHKCKTCGAKKDAAAHTLVDGVCSVCGYGCKHTGGTATCDKLAVCTTCGKEYGELLAHTPGEAATCSSEQKCTVCGAVVAGKLDHELEFVDAKDATCAEAGWEKYEKCKNCDYNTKKEIAATGNHTYGEWVIEAEATTKATGKQTHTCKTCGFSESEVIPMVEGGDIPWVLIAVLAALVCAVVVIIVIVKKKKDN